SLDVLYTSPCNTFHAVHSCTQYLFLFFFSILLRPPSSTLFPYTTLFRSDHGGIRLRLARDLDHRLAERVERLLRLGLGRLDHQRSEEHTSELQSRSDLVCRLLLEKKKKQTIAHVSKL